jgi:HEAT repeat protein
MKRALLGGLLIVVVLAAVGLWLMPDWRYKLLRMASKEPWYEDPPESGSFRPASYWLKAATDSDDKVREHALFMLGRVGKDRPEEAIPILIPALKDNDAIARKNAALSLGTIGPEARAGVAELVETLKDGHARVREAVAGALGRIHADPKTVVPALMVAMKDGDGYVRLAAMGGFSGFGADAEPAVPALAEAMKLHGGRDVGAATVAMSTLRSLGPLGVPYLVNALSDTNAQCRALAAQAFGAMGEEGKKMIPQLKALLKDPEPTVRIVAAKSLWQLGGPKQDTITVLVEGVKNHKSYPVRKDSIVYLGEMKADAKDAVSTLVEALKDEYDDVREQAALSLGLIGVEAKPAAPALLAIKDNKEEEMFVRKAAVIALFNITGEDFGVAQARSPTGKL